MEVLIYIFLVIAVMWGVQLYFAVQQSQRFSKSLKQLRTLGESAVGIGGFRYRGGRAFVALSHKEGVVTGAKVLTGLTVFASPVDYPELVGKTLVELTKEERIPTLRKKVQAAAKMATEVLLAGPRLNESDAPKDA